MRSSAHSLTQRKLSDSFTATKRSASNASSKQKQKAENISGSVINLTSDSSDEEQEVEDKPAKRSEEEVAAAPAPAPKRRKIARDTSAANVAEKLQAAQGKKARKNGDAAPPALNENAKQPAEGKLLELKHSDKKWNKAFNAAKAKNGHLATIHTEGQSKVAHILRSFDLSYEYGPCVGVSRLERWERAEALGLNPPPEVRDILTTRQGVEADELSQCVFYGEV
ncbi:hypothetical protein PUNSTDRAFT_54280 [Punctularia strigosozonata HHB-11173 SS5]|uniref:uncharacterized protein n=1 Tax=Punctularia strigosozonata (strain HHB-11173) TaxID=741275 RepID=UPI00044171DD|nr:uncharacterized protein PUNSTDRAFT_54280 [Punctularia strigosozonata HHB-11173 SS5]EIN05967.1 hypothetical protein PUNSTDRAFT_54280 [Punctularia strigosozonata HHB-11173 SS5]